ncbi:cyclic nucleotide-binding domain-containing protein [Magnetofaba australis]|uniref:Putative cyclic nucleotide-binding protein n=1 Tax=Magnetofaba australis IT-1 TaxID=1434232 RepID=A0A1Y2K6X2_9PROT|nr:cyclic nucleotide-binding domain-containing protein [Magnetofaba australis]OSM05290.1 putative cyclic nucleotide-binding protein [Magnetofaba australis IT-1]
MGLLETLARSALFVDLSWEQLSELEPHVRGVSMSAGRFILRQHDEARRIFVLVSGAVQHLVQLDGAEDPFLVDVTDAEGSVLGWSAFRAPYRYMETARCQSDCLLISIERAGLEAFLTAYPQQATGFLCAVAGAASERLARAIGRLVPLSAPIQPPLPAQTEALELLADVNQVRDAVRHTPFFEEMDESLRERLLDMGQRVELEAGQAAFRVGDASDRLFLLADGRIQLLWPCSDAMQVTTGSTRVPYQTLSSPGQTLGWTALVEKFRQDADAVALERSVLLALPREPVERAMREDPALGALVMRRLLWVIGGRLRTTRARLIAQRYDQESLAIQSLIDEQGPQLAVNSPLRRIPHYLANRLTLGDAFQVLENVRRDGDFLERNLAETCLDLMGRIHRDLMFFRGLQDIYEGVASAPAGQDAEVIRTRANLGFGRLFSSVGHRIVGWENLPEESGCIFIMNHLVNDTANQLPAGFMITLDTHFVSSMILYRHYGQNALRVVRRSELNEYEHQRYFDRFDYIYVGGDTGEEATESSRTRDREAFNERARQTLAEGRNLLICPEGNTTSTEESPLPFRKGIFHLAARLQPEPLICPIVVANFDKRLTRVRTVAMIQPPFRLSERMADPLDNEQIGGFVDALREQYREWVGQARALADAGE